MLDADLCLVFIGVIWLLMYFFVEVLVKWIKTLNKFYIRIKKNSLNLDSTKYVLFSKYGKEYIVRDLGFGMEDPLVGILQRLLNSKGYPISVDNYFGRTTYKLVRKFQRKNKLKVTGLVQEDTWNKLLEII